jgi:hypothetical protein
MFPSAIQGWPSPRRPAWTHRGDGQCGLGTQSPLVADGDVLPLWHDVVPVVDLAAGEPSDAQSRLDAAKQFGADIVATPSEDLAATVRDLTGGLGADVVIEAVGVPETQPVWSSPWRLLRQPPSWV